MVATHGGDTGDLIYFLPTLRAIGGGHLKLWSKPYTRNPMSPTKVASIASLLASQPYVKSVQFDNNATPDLNGDDFRATWIRLRKAGNTSYNIAAIHAITFGLDPNIGETKWLEVQPKPYQVRPEVIFSRSFRYRNFKVDYKTAYAHYHNRSCFIGEHSEWRDFCGNIGEVPYINTPTLLEAAQLISTCKLYIGNQSACYALAEGMKVKRVCEVWPSDPNCLFKGALHAWDANFKWPDL